MEHGILALCGYFEGMGKRKVPWSTSPRDAVQWCTTNGLPVFGIATVGAPDDAIRTIERLSDKTGGFGTLLFLAHNCADWAAMQRPYEPFAEYVVPACRKMNVGRNASNPRSNRQVLRVLKPQNPPCGGFAAHPGGAQTLRFANPPTIFRTSGSRGRFQ